VKRGSDASWRSNHRQKCCRGASAGSNACTNWKWYGWSSCFHKVLHTLICEIPTVEAVRRVLILGSISTVWRIRFSKPAVRRWCCWPLLTRCGWKVLCLCKRQWTDWKFHLFGKCLFGNRSAYRWCVASVLPCISPYTKCMSVYSAQVKSMLLSAIARCYHYTAYTSTASDTCTTQQCTLMNKCPLYTTCVLFMDELCFTQSGILKLKPSLSLKGKKNWSHSYTTIFVCFVS
jgi:hypothetical protein